MSSIEQEDGPASESEEVLEIQKHTDEPTVSAKSRKQGSRGGSSRKLENKLIDQAITRCSKGERRCRACAKNMNHETPPAYITCVYCKSIHGFYHVRTGRQAREKIYITDHDGHRVSKYNDEGAFAGYRMTYGDLLFYDDGTPVPETKRITACSRDSCKFYKISVSDVEKYDRMTGGKLDKV
jgi:hypothetical protein